MNLTVTNRELLRNYKELKEKLVKGDVEEIVIPQDRGFVIKISVQKELTPMQKLIKMVKEKPILNVKRSRQDMF